SGSGKSTAGRLAAGLHRPWSGRILLDGIPREELPREVIAASVSYVDQEVCLFEGTVRDNVTLWDDSISDEAVTQALHDAVIVAHRLCTVREADEIIVFEGGQVVERGRHPELINSDGLYARLVATGKNVSEENP